MKLGIVGLPNVGKSHAVQRHYQRGRGSGQLSVLHHRPERRHGGRAGRAAGLAARSMYQPKKYTPAVIEFVDIAGLVKGASKGEGLGNKFLSQHPRLPTRSSTSCAALTTRTSSTSRAAPTRCATSISSTSSSSWPTWRWSSAASTRRSEGRQGRQEVHARGGGVQGAARAPE